MNTSTVRRSTILSAACAVALLGADAALAAPSPKALEVLTARAAVANAELPAYAKAGSGIGGVLNGGAMSAPELTFTLSDGREITARLQRVARDDAKGTQSWVGTVDSTPGSVVVVSKTKGVVSGFASVGSETLEILPTRGGKHVLFEVDDKLLPGISEPARAPQVTGDALGTTSDYGIGASALAAADGKVIQDLLVAYTATAANRYGQATLESMIVSAVEAANQAYLNSGVAITLNLVGLKKVALTEKASQLDTLNALRVDTEVANLRSQTGADIVTLVGENSNNCGQAWVMQTVSTAHASYAFGSVYSACLSQHTLAHEIGHIQGLMHDRANSSYGGSYPYSYGYRVCASDGTGFRDVMSYSCTGAPRVLLFSSPYLTYNGHEAGIAYETNPAQSAENVRSLNNTAATVAAFRSSTTTAPSSLPAAPSGLAVQSAAYNQVRLGWVDNAANETGFRLERSGDGVNFAEVATLGADVKTYTDAAVASKATYYYRVRAYNSTGASGYSSTVNVTTPDVPPPLPPAPSGVSAADNADGTARVAWTVGATNATSFEVRREKLDPRKGTWGSAITAATVPSSVFSIVDASGSGTYRYSVRASNSGGSSAYAGPAQVSVTSTTSGTSTKKVPPSKGR